MRTLLVTGMSGTGKSTAMPDDVAGGISGGVSTESPHVGQYPRGGVRT